MMIDEVACYSASKALPPDALAFQVRALMVQAQQLADAYMETLVPIRSYATLDGLVGNFAALGIFDKIDQPGALGDHDLDKLRRPFGECRVSSDVNDATTPSHEFLEMVRDPDVDLWIPMPDGRHIAYEIADPCQGDTYQIPVTIGEEKRWIIVSDFVLPAYFVAGAPGPYTFCDSVSGVVETIDAPFGVSKKGGGWRLLKGADGKVVSDLAGIEPPANISAGLAARARDPGSRSYRRGLRP